MEKLRKDTHVLCREMIAEGSVLLKNEGVLPLKKDERIAIFGRCQFDTYYSGMGSGGLVNRSYQINIMEGLKNTGYVCIDEQVAKVYCQWRKNNPYDNANGMWGQEPWFQKEMPLGTLAEHAAGRNEKAVIVIGRTAGEDKDMAYKPGSYLLTDTEREMIKKVTDAFENVIMVFNIGAIMDLSFLEDPVYQGHLKGAILSWQGGQETGNGIADVLCGFQVPSGKLPDTIVYHINDYYSIRNFGDDFKNRYEEDIYVGYRYFETFCPKRVQFPFGYGLSYTDFHISAGTAEIHSESGEVEFSVNVRNTGTTYAAKEVVQVYVEAPQGNLGKATRVLAAFAKTCLLQPGQEQEVKFVIPRYAYASYDDSGLSGMPYAWVLEPGIYRFFVGNSSRTATEVLFQCNTDSKNPLSSGYLLSKPVLVEQLEQAMAPVEEFERIKPSQQEGTYLIQKEKVPVNQNHLLNRILDRLPEETVITGDRGFQLKDAVEGRCSWKEFIAQLSEEDLSILVRAEGSASPKVTPGTGGAMGGVSDSLLHYGIPLMCGSDGPNGVRMDSGRHAVQIPIGTVLSSSWNEELVEELLERIGEECVRDQIDILFGPGMNIHRSPLNGRNFEYFSEDPLLNGKIAAAYTRGIQKTGTFCSLKHFACNNQESNRNYVDAVVSERALREIYLKGFEIAVKEGKAGVMMTTYCPVNGYWTAVNYDLNTTILRKEWGFEGVVVTDWWARLNHVVKRGMSNVTDTASMIRAQNDLYCVVENYGAPFNSNHDNTLAEYKLGNLTLGEMQRNAENICRFAARTIAFQRPVDTGGKTLYYNPQIEADHTCDEKHTVCGSTSCKVDFTKGKRHLLTVEADSLYQVWFTYRCKGYGVTQSTLNVTMNGEDFLTLIVNGTGNQWRKVRLLNVSLKQGLYMLEGQFPKLGMETEGLVLVPVEEGENQK